MRRAETPPPRSPANHRRSSALELSACVEDLRRSEAERQRLRRENEKLKEELEAARRTNLASGRPLLAWHPRRDCLGAPVGRPGAAYGRRAHRRPPAHIDEIYRRAAAAPVSAVSARDPAACGWRCSIKKSCRCSARWCAPFRRGHRRVPAVPHARPRPPSVANLQRARGRRGAARAPTPWPSPCSSTSGSASPYGKIAALLRDRFGLHSSRPGGVVQAIQRAARQTQPTYDAFVRDGARQSGRDRR